MRDPIADNRRMVHIHSNYEGSNDLRGFPNLENSWALAESMQHWARSYSG